ncbi:uncharacterized protein LOC144761214 [Lissotriton helveticus]
MDRAIKAKEALQEIIEQDLRDFNNQEGQETKEGNAPSTSASNLQTEERQRVRQLLQTDSETEQNDNVVERQPQSTATVTNRRLSRRRRLQQFSLHRGNVTESGQFGEGPITGNLVEDKILKLQRLQGKDIRMIKGKLGHISKQMGSLTNSVNKMINVMKTDQETSSLKLDRIANSLETMCTLMQKQQNISGKRQVRLLTNMQAHNRQMTRLSNCTSGLCKQTLSTQVLLMKTFEHIQKGMGTIYDPSGNSHSNVSPVKQLSMKDSGASSAVSGTLEHCLSGTRRSNRKQNDASNMAMHSGRNAGKALGVRGRKK